MASRDFENLIKQGYLRTENAEAIVIDELGRLYRQAYDKAMRELMELYIKLGDKIDLPEARKYRRLEGILLSIADEYKKVTGQAIVATGYNSFQSFQEAFYSYSWAMEQAVVDGTGLNVAKLDTTWAVIPVDAIRASVMSEDSGLNYIKTFDKSKFIRLSDIQSALTRGLANGHAYRKTANEIKDVFDRGYSDAVRVVRQESGRNFTEGFLAAHDRAIENGILVKKRWDATADGRTRESHIRADGQYADKDGNFHVGGSKGQGPHVLDDMSENYGCRCRATDELEGFPPELRRYGKEIAPYVPLVEWAEESGLMKNGKWIAKK